MNKDVEDVGQKIAGFNDHCVALKCEDNLNNRERPNDQRRNTRKRMINSTFHWWLFHPMVPALPLSMQSKNGEEKSILETIPSRGVRGNERHVKMPWRKRCQMGDQDRFCCKFHGWSTIGFP